MNYRGTENIEIYERKFSLEHIYHMFVDGRIQFPLEPLRSKVKMEKELEQLLDIVWMGIPLPAVYVSELQNGNFLILENDDTLWKLLYFLDGRYEADYRIEENSLYHGNIQMLRSDEPRLAMGLYDTVISFQIIDYRTPKYLHMSIGKLVEHWNITREQSIREMLYDPYEISVLNDITKDMNHILSRGHLRGNSTIMRYRTLYMLMNWFVYIGVWQEEIEMQEQLLLEKTLEFMKWQGKRINELLSATNYFGDYIFSVLAQNKKGTSKKIRKSILDKYLGIFVCMLDMAKRRGTGGNHVNYILLEQGVFPEICRELERHQLTKRSIEGAFERWEREL